MKLTVNHETEKVRLKVKTTSRTDYITEFPLHNIHHWYPFNINFYYKYSTLEKFLYLAKDRYYEGENYYKADTLKKSNKLQSRDGVMFHPRVYARNRYIMDKARSVGIPTLKDQYDIVTVEQGFLSVSSILEDLKTQVSYRMVDNSEEDLDLLEDNWESKIWEHLTEEEQEVLIEIGEIYSMLTLMRKIAQGR